MKKAVCGDQIGGKAEDVSATSMCPPQKLAYPEAPETDPAGQCLPGFQTCLCGQYR